MRLGLFGGTFDPVHYGHLLLAECCREQCRLDAVWFLPAATAPHKQDREPTPAEQRIEMLELATAGNPAFSVCRYEADRGGVNYTVDTLAHFHAEHPIREFSSLWGPTCCRSAHWRDAHRVCELAVPIAASRAGTGPMDLQRLAVRRFAGAHRGVSRAGIGSRCPRWALAAEIRRRVALGQSIRYLTPPAVETYIKTHRLYLGVEKKIAASEVLSHQDVTYLTAPNRTRY